jgi:hypothetical protein
VAEWTLRRYDGEPQAGRDVTSHPPGGDAVAGTSGAAKVGATMTEHTTGGKMSLAELADGSKCQPSAILRLTAEHSPGGAYPANVAAYINGVFRGTIAATDHMPAGLHLYLP